ncbi:GGDEF domain-containing protein [Hahella sp. NBU794]|uniref:GGDEF domain-containing protein n=1 Tax=Hahella sp. NBU794 TaxID=3422590 RepID=UPI003D6DF382
MQTDSNNKRQLNKLAVGGVVLALTILTILAYWYHRRSAEVEWLGLNPDPDAQTLVSPSQPQGLPPDIFTTEPQHRTFDGDVVYVTPLPGGQLWLARRNPVSTFVLTAILRTIPVLLLLASLVVLGYYIWKTRIFAERVKELIMYDPVTKVLNWRFAEERCTQMVKHCRRYKEEFSFLVLDGDHFIWINDNFGPEAGDEALIFLAETIKNVIREVDILGRYGGEKFVIGLPSTDLNGAVVVAERIRQLFEQCKPTSYDVRYSVSIGCAQLIRNEDLHDTIKRATHALYRAIKGGRNRVAASKNHEAAA